jgi:hypothetical protein
VERAEMLKKFKDLNLQFICYNEGTLGVFLRDDNLMPKVIKEIY